MANDIKEFARDRQNGDFDAVGLVIMSHGDEKYIDGACPEKEHVEDNDISIRTEVRQQFSNLLAPHLKNVTKILIYQSCRGDWDLCFDPTNRVFHNTCEGQEGDSCTKSNRKRSNPSNSEALFSEMFEIFPTQPGNTSGRNKTTGSCFIQAFCEVRSYESIEKV